MAAHTLDAPIHLAGIRWMFPFLAVLFGVAAIAYVMLVYPYV